jgi:hypothetical protein
MMKYEIEELYVQIRKHPVYQHLISLEAALSYPVPSLRENGMYLRFLVYRRGKASRGQFRPVYRPYARLGIEYPSGRWVEYADLRFTENAPVDPTAESVGEAPNPAIADLSFDETVALRSSFFAALESIVPLVEQVQLPAEQRIYVATYRELFDRLVEPGLRPYYQALSPSFFRWVEAIGS